MINFINISNHFLSKGFCKIIFIFLSAVTTSGFTGSGLYTDDATLTLTKILKNYDVRLRPNFGADPLYVGIELQIAEINEFSEVNMDYTITIILNQYWKDERLAFSTRDEMLTFTGDFAQRIWVPDIFFPADKSSFIHDVIGKNQMVQLHGDGSILYAMRFTTRESCQMDLRNFPLDSQNCSVEIESYGYTVRDVVMYWKESAIFGVEGLKLPQFRISGYNTTDRIESLATGVYQRLTLSLKFERHFGFFFFQMYLPTILIVMLSWVSFWISNDATAARVALGITTVLTMTTINNSVRSSLPRISYIKAIDIYLVVCFLFVFAALIEYAAVNYIFWERKKIRKILSERTKESRFRKMCKIIANRKRKKFLKYEKKNTLKSSIEVIEDEKTSTNINCSTEPKKIQRSASFSGPIGMERVRTTKYKFPKAITQQGSRRRFRQIFGTRATAFYPKMVQDVSSVDNYSRVIFPCSFLLFNAFYWSTYAIKG